MSKRPNRVVRRHKVVGDLHDMLVQTPFRIALDLVTSEVPLPRLEKLAKQLRQVQVDVTRQIALEYQAKLHQ